MKKIRYGKCKQKPGPKSLNQKTKIGCQSKLKFFSQKIKN